MNTWMQRFLPAVTLCFVLLISCERDVDLYEGVEELSTEDTVSDDDNDDSTGDHDSTDDYSWDSGDVIYISLNENSIDVNGSGASAEGSILTISSSGTYSFSGSLSDGQIIVDTEDDEIVRLILSGVDISCESNAPVYIENAEKAMIVLDADTENFLSDGSSYSSEEDANAAVFSKQDLTIYGEGSLSVTGNYNDGITSKDGLIIASGNINVEAVDDGIRGKNYLIVKEGDISIIAGGDGLKSDNDEDTDLGYIEIENGSIEIISDGDAIQAVQNVEIYLGDFDLNSGGGSNAYLSSDESAKGIKSDNTILIYGGTINIDAADDAIHSDGDLAVYDGTFYILSGDDAIHSEYDSDFSNATVYIEDCYEGLESALGSINIFSGNFDIIASDDAINVSAGGASDGGPGHKSMTVTSDYALNITGGYIYVDCEGDGLDSNDLLYINGGVQLVNSAQYNSNSALDYDGSCVVDGGFLLAVGSSQMSKAPGSSSGQYSFMVDFRSEFSAGNIIHVEDSEGNDILNYKTSKDFQSVVFSSSELEYGTTYLVYVGGSITGTETDGLYSSASYSGGTKYTEFTISQKVTTINL